MIQLPAGEARPSVGLGTWRMGEAPSARSAEVKAIRAAIDLGYRVIDTAEMYGEGGAETLVGIAIGEALRTSSISRADLFIVTKVYPQHATTAGVTAACARSLKRLGLDQIDAYLLHWRGSVPLAETVAAFEALRSRGLIRHWGVSNFDVADMNALWAVDGGRRCAINQIYYSLTQRGAGYELLHWHEAHAIVTMAYSPIDQGALATHPKLTRIAARVGATPAQIALAWLMAQHDVMAIPKAVNSAHLRQNLAAIDVRLTDVDMRELDEAFPSPQRSTPLAML